MFFSKYTGAEIEELLGQLRKENTQLELEVDESITQIVVNHELNKKPRVVLLLPDNTIGFVDTVYIDNNKTLVKWDTPVKGILIIN